MGADGKPQELEKSVVVLGVICALTLLGFVAFLLT